MKALFIGCHCDDIELGCGGTINKYISLGIDVVCCTLSKNSIWKRELVDFSESSRTALESLGVVKAEWFDFTPNEFYKSRQEVWQVVNDLEKRHQPDVVFTVEQDNQQDHVTLFEETMRNFRKTSVIAYKPCLRNAPDQSYSLYEELSRANLDAKKAALEKYFPLYKDVVYFKMENIEAMARMAGIYVESEFAESFSVVKLVSLSSRGLFS